MRKLVALIFALLFVVGGTASVAAQATPAATPGAAGPTASGATDPGVGETATYYSKNNKKIATVGVTKVERPWKDYGKYEEPDAGTEYVGVTIEIENVSSGNVKVDAYDFSLQDSHGHLLGRSYTDGKENAKVVPLQDTLAVKAGASETVLIVFKVDEGTELAHLFWQPDGGILVTVANLAGQ